MRRRSGDTYLIKFKLLCAAEHGCGGGCSRCQRRRVYGANNIVTESKWQRLWHSRGVETSRPENWRSTTVSPPPILDPVYKTLRRFIPAVENPLPHTIFFKFYVISVPPSYPSSHTRWFPWYTPVESFNSLLDLIFKVRNIINNFQYLCQTTSLSTVNLPICIIHWINRRDLQCWYYNPLFISYFKTEKIIWFFLNFQFKHQYLRFYSFLVFQLKIKLIIQ